MFPPKSNLSPTTKKNWTPSDENQPGVALNPGLTLQNGSSWGLSFFRFLGAEFFRFLWAEFFSAKKNKQTKKPKKQKTKKHKKTTKKHSPSSASASSGPWVVFFFLVPFAHKHQENQKNKKNTKKHSPSSEDNTLLMLS